MIGTLTPFISAFLDILCALTLCPLLAFAITDPFAVLCIFIALLELVLLIASFFLRLTFIPILLCIIFIHYIIPL